MFISLFVGLAITAALGFLVVGSLNLISVAFAVLFVGIGVDFGIQFSVRYRAERYEVDDLDALARACRAARRRAADACGRRDRGRLPVVPADRLSRRVRARPDRRHGHDHRVLTSITLLPALLKVLNPPGEKEPLGFAFARAGRSLHGAPSHPDHRRHRGRLARRTAAALLSAVRFQSDEPAQPARSNRSRPFSICARDPNTGANAIDVLAPISQRRGADRRAAAQSAGGRAVMTLDFFVPADQEQEARRHRGRARQDSSRRSSPRRRSKPPTDEDNVAALNEVVDALNEAAEKHRAGRAPRPQSASPPCSTKLAKATPDDARRRPRRRSCGRSRPRSTTCRTCCRRNRSRSTICRTTSKSNWITADGRARVEALPKGDPNDNETLRKFARAVLAVEPDATGGPISILESGDTIVRAFFEAGAWAFISIAILLWIVLRRFGDVLLTLVPLLLAGVVTLEICVLIGHAAQLRQHHRAAAAARHRRRVQDLLHHGVAGRTDRPAAIEPDARGVLQRARPPRPRSAACGCRAIPARRAWASCWRCRCSRRSPRRCCSSRC